MKTPRSLLALLALASACGSQTPSERSTAPVDPAPVDPAPVDPAPEGQEQSTNAPALPEGRLIDRPTQITLCPVRSMRHHHGVSRDRVADAPAPCRVLRWDGELNQYLMDNQPIDSAQAEAVFDVYSDNAEALGFQDAHGRGGPHRIPPSMLIEGPCPVAELSPCVLMDSDAPDAFMCADDDRDGTPNSPEQCAHHRAYSAAFRAVWDAVMVNAADRT